MVLRPEAIRERLRELDRVLEELSRYRDFLKALEVLPEFAKGKRQVVV